MLEGISLDQLRTFIAAVDEGSFSAAGRRLARAQSVISQTLANLEDLIGVKLFDRSARLPVLTDQGRALLADARTVAGNVDRFKAQAKSLAGGLEPELSVAVDVMYPGYDAHRGGGRLPEVISRKPAQVRCRIERRGRSRAQRAVRRRRSGVMGSRAAAAQLRKAADGEVAHSRFVTAPACKQPRADSDKCARRVRPPRTH
jgi:DNA-binding transcriptional LysR family regulator